MPTTPTTASRWVVSVGWQGPRATGGGKQRTNEAGEEREEDEGDDGVVHDGEGDHGHPWGSRGR